MDRELQLGAHGPERLVLRVVEADHLQHVIARKQHSQQAGALRRPNFGDGLVDVVEEDLREPGPPVRRLAAEVGQPAVVRAQAGEPELVFLAGPRPGSGEHPGRIERRCRVREEDFRGDPLAVEVLESQPAVPVQRRRHRSNPEAVVHGPVLVQLLRPSVVEVARPRVERLVITALEVRLVVPKIGTTVAVRRDHDLAVRGCRAHANTPYDGSLLSRRARLGGPSCGPSNGGRTSVASLITSRWMIFHSPARRSKRST